jgi:methylase of polypeptide subunit release factors
MGVDLSPVALSLARKNLEHNISLDVLRPRAREEISFHRGDVLARNTNTSDSTIPSVEDLLFQTAPSELDPADGCETLPAIDLLISNPPYISPSDFRNGTTARSVRLFEPRLALVPPINPSPSLNASANANASAGDIFYHRLLELSLAVRARLTVLECGDKKQAERVVELFRGMGEALGRKGGSATFTARIWPGTEGECRANGFHVVDGSRCVVIRRGMSF